MRANVIDVRRIRLQVLGLPSRLHFRTPLLESGRIRLDDGSAAALIASSRGAPEPLADPRLRD